MRVCRRQYVPILVRASSASATIQSMSHIPRGRSLLWLLAFLGVSFAAAGLGSAFTVPALDGWYRKLRKPAWTPPDAVFGPVWTILYVQMAVGGWLVYRGTRTQASRRTAIGNAALGAWSLQLLLNVGWSAAFFGFRSPAAGLLTIVPLWAAIGTTAGISAPANPLAGVLLLPYLAWASCAAALSLRIWHLNREA